MRHRVKTVTAFAVAATFAITAVAAVAQEGDDGQDRDTTAEFASFDELGRSAPCETSPVVDNSFRLAGGFRQDVVAQELDGGSDDFWDMNTQNEADTTDAGRYIYRTHEIRPFGSQVTVTDLQTGETEILFEREDWEAFDGIVWTPQGTILAAEETDPAAIRDPNVPQAEDGLVYEFFIDPEDPTELDPDREPAPIMDGGVPTSPTGDGNNDILQDGVRARPALGSKSHEGMRFDGDGNVYGISETDPGAIYRYVPEEGSDDPLSEGQLQALKTEDGHDGDGEWVDISDQDAMTDAQDAATRMDANAYDRPEDVETGESTGRDVNNGGDTLYVALTGTDEVLAIDLGNSSEPFAYDYVFDPTHDEDGDGNPDGSPEGARSGSGDSSGPGEGGPSSQGPASEPPEDGTPTPGEQPTGPGEESGPSNESPAEGDESGAGSAGEGEESGSSDESSQGDESGSGQGSSEEQSERSTSQSEENGPPNAPEDFDAADNLALDSDGNLVITEDVSIPLADGQGDDLWIATPPSEDDDEHAPAAELKRLASLTDCAAEPTGVYFAHANTGRYTDGTPYEESVDSGTLFVNRQHAGVPPVDQLVAIHRGGGSGGGDNGSGRGGNGGNNGNNGKNGGDGGDDGSDALPGGAGLLGAFARFDCGLFAQNFGSAPSKLAQCQRATQNALLDTAVTAEAACAQQGLNKRRRRGLRRSDYRACVLSVQLTQAAVFRLF